MQKYNMKPLFETLMVLSMLAVPFALSAQSPVITPKGDPSVKDDTIYALTVKAADHPDENTAILLDDGVVRFEKDGTGFKTYRSVVQLLKQAAVESWSEYTVSYDGDREEFTLNWARVVDLDGKVVSAAPLHVQELDAEVPEGSPIYTHQKQVRISLASVAPGRIVDLSYTVRTKKPILAGDYSSSWRITTGGTIRRSRYILDLPADSHARIHEFNMAKPPVVTRANGRTIRTWYVADQEYFRGQLFASDTNSVLQHLQLSGEVDWQTIARWYASLARDRYVVPPSARAWLDSTTASGKTPLEKLKLLHRAIAQDIRYVSLSLGIGGFQPRMPDEVLKTSSGDCKDKATTFVALARTLGFEAYPVLVNSSARLDTMLATAQAFDHEIATVKVDNKWMYLDLTDAFGPFGEDVGVMNNDYGLVVRDDGRGELVHFPQIEPAKNQMRMLITGAIDTTGHFSGKVTVDAIGAQAYSLRSGFPDSLSAEQRKQVANNVAQSLFANATGDSVSVTRGRDLPVNPRFTVTFTAQPLRKLEDGGVLKLPFGHPKVEGIISQLNNEDQRRFWFNADGVLNVVENTDELRIALPHGWTVKLPPAVHARSAFGQYDASYDMEGSVLHIVHHSRGAMGVLPPTVKTELINFLKEIGSDDAEFLILQHTGK